MNAGRRRSRTRAWHARHAADPWVREARQAGYRSRAAYKLLDIDRRHRLLRPGSAVVDLGAAPGGWSQVAAGAVGPQGRVVAVDRLDMTPLPGVIVIHGDFLLAATVEAVRARLPQERADLVMSDMAPNLSGVRDTDQARSIDLAGCAVDFAVDVLRPNGNLLVKVFEGSGVNEFRERCRRWFRTCRVIKPGASRSASREIYLLGCGFSPDRESGDTDPGGGVGTAT